MKRRVRLTEGDIHRIVRRAVSRVLREGCYEDQRSYRGITYDANELDWPEKTIQSKIDALFDKGRSRMEIQQAVDSYCGNEQMHRWGR